MPSTEAATAVAISQRKNSWPIRSALAMLMRTTGCRVRSSLSYSQIPGIGPGSSVSLPRAGGGTVRLGPSGSPHLYLFFATWDQQVTDQEMIQHGKREDFAVLRQYLLGDAPQLSYGDAAVQLGASASSIKVAVHRMRRRFRDLVRDEIAQTVGSPEEVDDELRHLFESLGRA